MGVSQIQTAPAEGRHYPQLDSLRAIAIGLVMIEHYAAGLARFVPIGPGTLGVNLFFVLSGYLIMSGLLRDMSRETSAKVILVPFFTKRFFRLFPVYFAALVALTILGIERVTTGIWWHTLYLSNVYPSFGGNSTVFWSLAVEEQFYIVLPLFIFLGSREKLEARLWIALGACLAYKVVLFGLFGSFNWRMLPAAADPLLVGCLMAIRIAKNDSVALNKRDAILLPKIAILGGIFAVVIWLSSSQALRQIFNQILNGVFFAFIVYTCLIGVKGRFGAVLNNSVLRYLGRISYGLYLVHSFVPDILRFLAPHLSEMGVAILTLPIVLGICAASYRFFEGPLLRYGHSLAKDFRIRLKQRSLSPQGGAA